MILAFDIGNTNIVFCAMQNREVLHQFRLETDINKTTDEYAIAILSLMSYNAINPKEAESVMISSVVPILTFVFDRLVRKYFAVTPYIVDVSSPHGLDIKLDFPAELGADRLLSALAAHTLYKQDAVVVDFGTATTLEAVSSGGEFLGGVIFPGVKLSASVLHSNTAKLPQVDFKRPLKVVGTNTVMCMQSGLFYGYVELIDGLISRIKAEAFEGREIVLLSTGGMGRELSEASRFPILYVPNLIPIGLYIMYEKVART